MTATKADIASGPTVPNPVVLATVSLIVAPLMVLVVGAFILAVAPGWAKSAADGGSSLTLVLAGALAGLIVALVARLRGGRLLITPTLGAAVGVVFALAVFTEGGVDLATQTASFLVYAGIQAAVLFVASWVLSRR